ncbi:MAG: hypothetical protein DSY32_04930 [Aquifex sp.]|nr:MAG: hypothetical protein DSY32_04930 [Aquifex sp.]
MQVGDCKITIKQIGDFLWFSPRTTKPSYGSVIKALKHHIRYITKKTTATAGDYNIILNKAKEEVEKYTNPRVGLKFYIAVPNDWDAEKALTTVGNFVMRQFGVPEENIFLAFHDDAKNKHVHVLIFPRNREGKKLRIGRRELRSFHKAWEDLLIEEGYEIFKLPEDASPKKIPIGFIKKNPDLYREFMKLVARYKKTLYEEEDRYLDSDQDRGQDRKEEREGRTRDGSPDGSPESSLISEQKKEIKLQVEGLGFSEDAKVAIVCTTPDKQPVQRIVRVAKLFEEDFLKFLRKLNADGYNVYISVNELKEDASSRKKEDFKDKQKHIYLDIDGDKLGKDGYEILKQILKDLDLPQPTLVVQTSKNNLQVVWTLSEELDKEEIERINSEIAERYELDKAIDVSRVFRLAGFFNRKKGKGNFVYVVKKASSLKPVSLEHFKRFLKSETTETPAYRTEERKTEAQGKAEKLDENYLIELANNVVLYIEHLLKHYEIAGLMVYRGKVESLLKKLADLSEEIKENAIKIATEKRSYSEAEQAYLYRAIRKILEKNVESEGKKILIKKGFLRDVIYLTLAFREALHRQRLEKLQRSPDYPYISVSSALKFLLEKLKEFEELGYKIEFEEKVPTDYRELKAQVRERIVREHTPNLRMWEEPRNEPRPQKRRKPKM